MGFSQSQAIVQAIQCRAAYIPQVPLDLLQPLRLLDEHCGCVGGGEDGPKLAHPHGCDALRDGEPEDGVPVIREAERVAGCIKPRLHVNQWAIVMHRVDQLVRDLRGTDRQETVQGKNRNRMKVGTAVVAWCVKSWLPV